MEHENTGLDLGEAQAPPGEGRAVAAGGSGRGGGDGGGGGCRRRAGAAKASETAYTLPVNFSYKTLLSFMSADVVSTMSLSYYYMLDCEDCG